MNFWLQFPHTIRFPVLLFQDVTQNFPASEVHGIGFDATASLVVLNGKFQSVAVNDEGNTKRGYKSKSENVRGYGKEGNAKTVKRRGYSRKWKKECGGQSCEKAKYETKSEVYRNSEAKSVKLFIPRYNHKFLSHNHLDNLETVHLYLPDHLDWKASGVWLSSWLNGRSCRTSFVKLHHYRSLKLTSRHICLRFILARLSSLVKLFLVRCTINGSLILLLIIIIIIIFIIKVTL